MNDRTKIILMRQREILKGYHAADADAEETDEAQGLEQPALTLNKGQGEKIALPKEFDNIVKKRDILELFEQRVSRRKFTEEALNLTELSFLLWNTQGIRQVIGRRKKAAMRTVPSAGARHAFETSLFVNRVQGLCPGLYHYDAMEHALEYVEKQEAWRDELPDALGKQEFAASSPVVFVWSAVPYRMEWRYGVKAAKYSLIDAGHICQNLYMAGEALELGVCAIGAYDQERLDELLGLRPGLSGEMDYECAVYAAAVGRIEVE